ncbi:MAG: PKD domain-containing protein [Planctomycetes bacterium]|nr:PKD domain-containing protein [Planctomycetota bacterium]
MIGWLGAVVLGLPAAALPAPTPSTIDFAGPEGGPFPSGSSTLPLVNTTGQGMLWRTRQSLAWASFSTSNGFLPPGSSTSVQVSINSAVANWLPAGVYDAFVLYRTPVGQPPGVLAHVRLTVEQGNPGTPTMSSANRTSGVAPLSVFFDAVGEASGVIQPGGSTPDYASMHYRWDFGDEGSGTWAINGKPKNSAFGYVTAHVFETPGTYRVSLQVTEPGGTIHDYHQDITVTDPDVVYAGRTYYVSATGNDSNDGLTPGTAYRTAARAMNTLFASHGPRRVLFRRGDVWPMSTSISASGRNGPYTIGAYGTGANPVIQASHAGNGIALTPSVSDVRIVDVDFSGPHPSASDTGVQLGRDSLLLRSTVRGFRTAVAGHDSACIGNTVADCSILDNGTYGLYYAPAYNPNVVNDPPRHLAVMGNRFDNAIGNSLLRTYVSRSLWQANLFQRAGQSATRLLGIHAPKKAEFVSITDNVFRATTVWVLEIGPENTENGGSGGVQQVVENVVLEGNRFSVPPASQVDTFVLVWGRHVTVRNNIFDHTGANWGASVRVSARGIGPVPVGTRIDNNTVYRATPSAGPWQFVTASSQDQTRVRNNIVYSPASSVTVAQGTVSAQNNLTANPLFQNAAAGDFRLQATSPAIDSGASLPLRIDFAGNGRPLTPGGCDIGALERL